MDVKPLLNYILRINSWIKGDFQTLPKGSLVLTLLVEFRLIYLVCHYTISVLENTKVIPVEVLLEYYLVSKHGCIDELYYYL